jgi:hypothetical protein
MPTSSPNFAASHSTAASQENGRAPGKYEAALLIVWLTACSTAVFWRALLASYAFDDVDQLHAVAAFRSGQVSFFDWFLLNHNEHIVPLLRLYFWAASAIGGMNAWPFQLMLLLTYVAGAVGCGWIFFSLTRSRLGAFLAGTVYAGISGTFSRIAPTNVGLLWMKDSQGWHLGSVWDVPPISPADAAVENQILDEWAKAENRRPYSCVVDGKVQDMTDPHITSCSAVSGAAVAGHETE